MNASTFNALADPSRLQIVELLKANPLTVGEIATQLHLRQPQTSKHLRVLHEAGLVAMQADANRRICHLRPEPFQELDEWLSAYRRLWENRFDQLDTYLHHLQTLPNDTTPEKPSNKGDQP